MAPPRPAIACVVTVGATAGARFAITNTQRGPRPEARHPLERGLPTMPPRRVRPSFYPKRSSSGPASLGKFCAPVSKAPAIAGNASWRQWSGSWATTEPATRARGPAIRRNDRGSRLAQPTQNWDRGPPRRSRSLAGARVILLAGSPKIRETVKGFGRANQDSF
jgi:hypothetical protein